MRNRFYASILKIAMLSIVSICLSASPVLAKTGDLWNGSTNVGSVSYLLLHPNKFLDLLAHLSNYHYEVNGKGYDILQANDLFNANPNSTAAEINAKIESLLVGSSLVTQSATITSISSSYSSFITSFTVTTSPDVFNVKVNQTDMLYQGNNTFILGMSSLKQGSKVTIYIYDSTNKLLKSQSYTLN